MAKAILEFVLPEEEPDFRYAVAGRDALLALEAIDQWARGILKHGEPEKEDPTALLEYLRVTLIPRELLELLV